MENKAFFERCKVCGESSFIGCGCKESPDAESTARERLSPNARQIARTDEELESMSLDDLLVLNLSLSIAYEATGLESIRDVNRKVTRAVINRKQSKSN